MIVFCDIDGCLTLGKNKTVSLDEIKKISNFLDSFYLCTGRSALYVEAFSQFLPIDRWCICENGCYFYHPRKDKIEYSNLISNNVITASRDLKNKLLELIDKIGFSFELGKEICISLNPQNGSTKVLYDNILHLIDRNIFEIHFSTTAVDITPKGINKGVALKEIIINENLNLNQVLAIGDSNGDLPFMNLAAYKACPNNSIQEVKDICNYVSKLNATQGVVDILENYYHKII